MILTGFGYGKGATAAEATDRAFVDAERNMISIPLYRFVSSKLFFWLLTHIIYRGGLSCDFQVRKRGSFVRVWTQRPSANRNVMRSNFYAHPVTNSIVEAFGFNNALMRTWKRRNWHSIFFITLGMRGGSTSSEEKIVVWLV